MNDAPARRLGPPEDTPILPWCQSVYTRGFMALHPFYRIPGVDPAQCDYGTVVIERDTVPETADLLDWVERQHAARKQGKSFDADDVDTLAKRSGIRIRWREVCAAAGFADHCALHRALRTVIRGLHPELADKAGAERLVRHCAEQLWFLPGEGQFQPVHEPALARLFRDAGHGEVIMGDEFGECARAVATADLLEDAVWRHAGLNEGFLPRRLIAPDGSLFACVHWDSFCTLILGTEEAFTRTHPERFFEGFWCTEHTTHAWLLEPPCELLPS